MKVRTSAIGLVLTVVAVLISLDIGRREANMAMAKTRGTPIPYANLAAGKYEVEACIDLNELNHGPIMVVKRVGLDDTDHRQSRYFLVQEVTPPEICVAGHQFTMSTNTRH